MRLAVFSPTYRPGGLDVLEASLMRQSFKDFIWIVGDQRFAKRYITWEEIQKRVDFEIMWSSSPIMDGNKRNLCELYNGAADFVVRNNIDMLVSLQDYIYLPEDGLEKFVSVNKLFPNDLLTGVTHISRDPFPNKIVDLEGSYTIFAEPYTDKPKHLSWKDVRVSELYIVGDDILPVQTGHWEANWAAVPKNILEAGIRWDSAYDKGIAYENMDFAQQANKNLGAKVILDKTNVAISLPHKDYFEGEREEIEEFSNRNYYEKKWL
jgi:hypothetical protein